MNYKLKETEYSEICFLDKFADGNGFRNMRKFLHEVIINFSEESFSHYKNWGEFPFIYGEKQIHSTLTPSIHKHTGNIWLEQPFKDYKKNQRFLDIATVDKNNIYLIELKHSWNSKTDKITQRAFDEWQIAIKQIKDINRKTIYPHFNKDFNIFKIALMVMPTYLSSNQVHNILSLNSKEYGENIFNEFDNVFSQEHNKPNFNGTIKIKNPNKYSHKYINGEQIYPYISFIGKVLLV